MKRLNRVKISINLYVVNGLNLQ
ncbi:hypothetical protein BLA29_007351 [Euroglyphus maynei]|uniref:Uncharacterized protein n=1 Tax=Euroglyphus maynei TaxID=6958 RepID=A0A1Y3B8X6_EURMA|nr:hypothetical protein BLA29_007351 [Euroglyphus maynei]